jgi:gluconokinase
MALAHNRTGCVIHTSYLPARFRWLARTQPHWFHAAASWVSIGEYLLHQFLGRRVASYSVASWSGLLNRQELAWDAEWLARLPISAEQMSPLGDIDQPLQGLLPLWADRWPMLQAVPWFPAIGDGAAANIGSGCDSPNRVALTIGSTGAMRVVVDPGLEAVPDGLWLYRVDRKRGLLGGATTEGGNLFGWLRQTLQLPPTAELERLLMSRRPAGHGLTVLPFVAGERAPGWREDARASLAGFTLHTDPVGIVQASLEAIAYRFALIYRRISPHLPAGQQSQIIASGGGLLSSPAWLQIMADVLGEPLFALEEKEATSRGLALLALEQLGVIAGPSALPPAMGQTYTPNPHHREAHQEALERQVRFYETMNELQIAN